MSDFIEVYDKALSTEFCQELLQLFEASPYLEAGRTGHGVEPDKKHSLDLYLDKHPEYQGVLNKIRQTTASYMVEYFKKYHFALIAPLALKVKHPKTHEPVDLTHENFTELAAGREAQFMQFLYRLGPIQAQKYLANEGNYQYWHCETYPQKGSTEALHRTLLFMYYLNDVEKGGTTDFYYQKKSIAPKTGRMVIAPAYFTHTHRGTIPKNQDKYILTSWVLFNQAKDLFG